ncbi:MAG: hypothetical protein QM754_12505 [Tepidisphaeraceae bacterium]
MRKPKFNRLIVIAIVAVLFALYLSGPVIASICEVGDRRGPVIYPQWLHEPIYMIVWDCTLHDSVKPRVGRSMPPRRWFYGL